MRLKKISPTPPGSVAPPLGEEASWGEWARVWGTAICPFCWERMDVVEGRFVRHGEAHRSKTACFGSSLLVADELRFGFVACD